MSSTDKQKKLTNFQSLIYKTSIVFGIIFAFEILLLLLGYIGLFHLDIKTGLWFIYEMFYGLSLIMTPYALVITMPSAGYFIYQFLKKNMNRRITFVVVTVAAMNLLPLLIIFGMNKVAEAKYEKEWARIHMEQKEYIGKTLPRFKFQAVEDERPPFTERDLQNKRSILVFLMGSHNPKYSPNYKIASDLHRLRSDLDAQVFIIANNTSKGLIKLFIDRHDIRIPLYYDPYDDKKDNLGILNSSEVVLLADTDTILRDILYEPRNIDQVLYALSKIH